MQDKKVVALIILTILAVISLIYGVTASPKGRAKDTAPIEGRAAITPAQNAATNVVANGRHAKRSQFKAWKRNPFAIGIVAPTPTVQLTLNGIIWDKVKPKAMIGDAIFGKGDTIGANKVVDILQDRVILTNGTTDFELKLEK